MKPPSVNFPVSFPNGKANVDFVVATVIGVEVAVMLLDILGVVLTAEIQA